MAKLSYRTNGTCSTIINIEVIDGIIQNIEFIGGCNGNLKGVSLLAKGMSCNDVITRLKGITCGTKTTSCPDQLAKALETIEA